MKLLFVIEIETRDGDGGPELLRYGLRELLKAIAAEKPGDPEPELQYRIKEYELLRTGLRKLP